MLLSTVIVHYRTLATLPACLRAIAISSASLETETVVVDNHSGDGVGEVLARDFPHVRLLSNPGNFGYARAVNRGIAETSGEFVLVMNPDCTLDTGAVETLIGHLRAHPRAAIVGPRIVNPDGSLEYSARAFPDHLAFLFNRYSLLTRWFPGNPYSRRYLLTDWDHATVRDVDWLSGACLMVRREAVRQVGPMDERFFMFNEDVDWCRRMKLANWTVTYVPGAGAVHHVGASRRRVAARVIVERHRGMIHYFHKHHPTNPLLTFLADTLIMVRAGVMLAHNAFRPRS